MVGCFARSRYNFGILGIHAVLGILGILVILRILGIRGISCGGVPRQQYQDGYEMT